jgi:class 3 adenylate cyclase
MRLWIIAPRSGPAAMVNISEQQKDGAPRYLQIGERMRLDVAGRILIDADGHQVPLQRMEFDLLLAFVRSPGRVLSRDFLLEASAGRRSEPFDRTIDVLVARLRKKIEVDPKVPKVIATVLGAGYKFVARPHPTRRADGPSPDATPRSPIQRRPGAAERRHLTIMTCALAEAATLAAQLDPEEWADLIALYHRGCAGIIGECGGTVAGSQGETITAYFGYPAADEHQAERAIRAALRTVDAVTHPTSGLSITPHTCVGIATGTVVAEDLSGTSAERELDVLGEAPHLAAHLLSIADSDAVIISESTRRLVGELFELRGLAPSALEGRAEPILAFEVLGGGPPKAGLKRCTAALLLLWWAAKKSLRCSGAAGSKFGRGRERWC